MKVLVIPDAHLKPWMFQRASELMKEIKPDRAVCLMDIADDWRQQFNLDLYVQTYDATIAFAKEYPETLWCYGNHDICYLWNQRETGYSKIAPWTVCEKLRVLRESLPDERQLAYLHRIRITRSTMVKSARQTEEHPIPCNMINCFCMFSDYIPLTLDDWIRLDKGRRERIDTIQGHII